MAPGDRVLTNATFVSSAGLRIRHGELGVLAVIRAGIPVGSFTQERAARRRQPVHADDRLASEPGLGASCMAGDGNIGAVVVKTLRPAPSRPNSLVAGATAMPGWPLRDAR
jgi:hypothetical protein